MEKDFVELFEKEDFVELGLKIQQEFKNIDNDKNIPKKDKYKVKKKRILEKLYERIDPFKESEKFFELEDWDLNKLAFVIAADSVARGLKMSQIRKIFNMSATIYRKAKKEDVAEHIARLSYVLAYTAGRHKEFEPLAKVLSKVLPQLKEKGDFEKVYSFLQAVVAYHKLLGGGE